MAFPNVLSMFINNCNACFMLVDSDRNIQYIVGDFDFYETHINLVGQSVDHIFPEYSSVAACVDSALNGVRAVCEINELHDSLRISASPFKSGDHHATVGLFILRRFVTASVRNNGATDVIVSDTALANRCKDDMEDDRKSLARELHDELGQYLVAIKAEAGVVHRAAQLDTVVPENAVSIIELVDAAFDALDHVIQRLRPAILDEFGLFHALEQMLITWRKSNPDIQTHFECNGDLTNIDEAINTIIYRLVQECLNNIAKHAQSNVVDIRISSFTDGSLNQFVRIEVSDNGVGMVLSTEKSTSFGLQGMRERVEMIPGAVFSIQSAPGQGTVVLAIFPVSRSV